MCCGCTITLTLHTSLRLESTALVQSGQQGKSVTNAGAAGTHILAAIDTEGNWYKKNHDLNWVVRNDHV